MKHSDISKKPADLKSLLCEFRMHLESCNSKSAYRFLMLAAEIARSRNDKLLVAEAFSEINASDAAWLFYNDTIMDSIEKERFDRIFIRTVSSMVNKSVFRRYGIMLAEKYLEKLDGFAELSRLALEICGQRNDLHLFIQLWRRIREVCPDSEKLEEIAIKIQRKGGWLETSTIEGARP